MKKVLNLTDAQIMKGVKIAGTKFDRRRKLTDKQLTAIQKAYENGTSISVLAEKYGVNYTTIRYHVDPEYREDHLYYTSLNTYERDSAADKASQVNYKRSLLAAKKVKYTA